MKDSHDHHDAPDGGHVDDGATRDPDVNKPGRSGDDSVPVQQDARPLTIGTEARSNARNRGDLDEHLPDRTTAQTNVVDFAELQRRFSAEQSTLANMAPYLRAADEMRRLATAQHSLAASATQHQAAALAQVNGLRKQLSLTSSAYDSLRSWLPESIRAATMRDTIAGMYSAQPLLSALEGLKPPSAFAELTKQFAGVQQLQLSSTFADSIKRIAHSALNQSMSAALSATVLSSMSVAIADSARTFSPETSLGISAAEILRTLRDLNLRDPAWSSSLTDVAVAVGSEQLESEPTPAILLAVREEVATSLTAAPEVVELDQEGGEDAFATLALMIWERVVARVPNLTQSLKEQLLVLIIGTLFSVGVAGYTLHKGDIDQAESLQATHEVRDAVRAQQQLQQNANGTVSRLIASSARPLRDNPAASATRIGTIPSGATMELRMQSERWLYVVVVSGVGAGLEGWVYLRDLRPAPP